MAWSPEENAYRSLAERTDARIVFVVFDGLGDIPGPDGRTPLEAAHAPNLDRLAREGACGLFDPVAPGITPGSGPGHLGLFGYDPFGCLVGRGVLSALGIDFPLEKRDIAARANLCTLDSEGRVADRRAGRISTAENERILAKLADLDPGEPDVEVILRTESEHRVVLVLRGEGLGAAVNDTDPQHTGVPPHPACGDDPASERTARIVTRLLEQVGRRLADEERANGMLLRGFDTLPDLPSLSERLKLRPVCIAQYPMYRGLARLVGMEIVERPDGLPGIVEVLRRHWQDHDFFFCHVKYTDKAGEDGDAVRKAQVIEEMDPLLTPILELGPDVVVVTADHSTPAPLRAHSWHPVPSLVWAPGRVRCDDVESFGETACARGGLGRQRLHTLLPLAMAHAGKFAKYGA